MAVLTRGVLTKAERIPVSNLVLRSFQTSPANNAAADEWIDTGLSEIVAIVGWATVGTAAPTLVPNFVKNAQGTGVAEGTNLGDLGVEGNSADTFEVTVLGRL